MPALRVRLGQRQVTRFALLEDGSRVRGERTRVHFGRRGNVHMDLWRQAAECQRNGAYVRNQVRWFENRVKRLFVNAKVRRRASGERREPRWRGDDPVLEWTNVEWTSLVPLATGSMWVWRTLSAHP